MLYFPAKVVVVVQAVELSRSIHMVVLHQLIRQPAKLGGKKKERESIKKKEREREREGARERERERERK